MSDRPRKPARDDWEDDLELTDLLDKFREQPEETTESRSKSSSEPPERFVYEEDDMLYGLDEDTTAPPPSTGRHAGDRVDPYREPWNPDESAAGLPDPPPPDTSQRSPSSSKGGAVPDWVPGERSDPYSSDSQYYAADAARRQYPPATRESIDGPQLRRRRQPSSRSVSIPTPTINDGTFVAFLAASLLSLMFMLASIASGIGDLPDWIPIHLDASGDPDRFGTSSTLWRIPFGIFMTIIMALVVAAILWKRDRFASRFVLAGTGIAQVLAWIAVIDILW